MHAESFYLCSRHLPPHENSAYLDVPVECAFALEYGDAEHESFLTFIRKVKGQKQINPDKNEDEWFADNAWYVFTDLDNKETGSMSSMITKKSSKRNGKKDW